MPELPEVETTRRGLSPLAEGRVIRRVVVRQPQLRWRVSPEVPTLQNTTIHALRRRGKWLIWDLSQGHLLWHLGMSGSFRAWLEPPTPQKHDHVDVEIVGGHTIRFTDPRRFGALFWVASHPETHPHLARLGPEPLSEAFTGEHLWQRSRSRSVPVKSFIMTGAVVVGVGNIYASEALFLSGIHPMRPAGRISKQRFAVLADAIVKILSDAIELGGTSLRDFTVGDGTPGYFGQSLQVYDQAGSPCPRPSCGGTIKRVIIGQRSTFYCPRCQR
jgi:formamidopyrimidine-DNA glycosylase